MADPATLAMLAKAAAAVLSSEKARKTIGWVIVAIFSPIIVLLVLLCSLLSGTAEHNTTALELCFHDGVISASVPEDYRGHIENMRDSFFVLDGGAAELDGQMENGDSLDRTRVKAIFYALYFGEEQPSQRAHKQYLDCFVTYEERTRTVTEADDAGNEVEVEETYTVAVPIRDLSVVYENIRSKMGTEITAEDQANATEIYYRILCGGPAPTYGSEFDIWSDGLPLSDAPFIGADGFCSPIGESWRSVVTSEFGWRKDPFTGKGAGHTGIDLGMPKGTPIRAALTGTVYLVRYSTTGDTRRENAQPISITHVKGNLAVAHNGNLVNAGELRREIELDGGIFRSSNDTEVLVYTIVKERLKCGSIEEAVMNTMHRIEGAYSLVVMSPRKLIAARDPHGFRPLCIGLLDNDCYIFASETCALDALGAKFIRDVEPGEVCVVENGELRSMHCGIECKSSACVFEYIYFARPDSIIDGASVELARQEAGKYLSIEHPVGADVVIGVPDSGIPAAIGYAKFSGIPYGVGLIKNRYIARTFIQPGQDKRERSVRLKLNALRTAIEGKRVIMVDDSIVRGTTCGRLVKLLRDAGAAEVHMRISAPPFRHPCFFGTDIPERNQLLAHNRTVEEMREIIGVDSLGFLSLEACRKIAVGCKLGFCDACFSGEYPIPVPEQVDKNMFETEIPLPSDKD